MKTEYLVEPYRKTKVIVIGGGQAGLAVGYCLKKRGIPFRILDANPRIGDAWRSRWDSLRLFTTARYTGLPGLPFPARGDTFPTKDQMADYLESYAKYFDIPVQTETRVKKLSKRGDRFVIETDRNRFEEAEQVVVAMGNYQIPVWPKFSQSLDPEIVQMHSHDYRNPAQLAEGGVLVVGVGNSGADIALEVARTHETWVSGKEPGVVPFRIDGILGRFVWSRLVRFIFHYVLSVETPIGKKQRPKLLAHTAPLVRVKPKDLVKAGIKRVPRMVGARDGWPLLADGHTLNVKNVIWCTGYTPGFSWIDLPIFDPDGRPRHDAGVVTDVPGMYFVGLHFLYAMSSATLIGVGRDAERIAGFVERRSQTTTSTQESSLPVTSVA